MGIIGYYSNPMFFFSLNSIMVSKKYTKWRQFFILVIINWENLFSFSFRIRFRLKFRFRFNWHSEFSFSAFSWPIFEISFGSSTRISTRILISTRGKRRFITTKFLLCAKRRLFTTLTTKFLFCISIINFSFLFKPLVFEITSTFSIVFFIKKIFIWSFSNCLAVIFFIVVPEMLIKTLLIKDQTEIWAGFKFEIVEPCIKTIYRNYLWRFSSCPSSSIPSSSSDFSALCPSKPLGKSFASIPEILIKSS